MQFLGYYIVIEYIAILKISLILLIYIKSNYPLLLEAPFKYTILAYLYYKQFIK